MVKRQCTKCNAIFYRKSHYDYHINRKFNCIQNENNNNVLISDKNMNFKICRNLQEFAENLQELAEICTNKNFEDKNKKILNLSNLKIEKNNYLK